MVYVTSYVCIREPRTMPVGRSGRIVIEIDPDLKQELYSVLEDEGLTLKQWFLDRVGEHLRGRNQLSLQLRFTDAEAVSANRGESPG
jgi:hypothetical protein